MRCLYVKNGRVVNIVEHDQLPHKGPAGEDVVQDTNNANVGDAVDISDHLKNRRIDACEAVIFQELLGLTNAVRELKLQPTLTAAQYRAHLRSRMQ